MSLEIVKYIDSVLKHRTFTTHTGPTQIKCFEFEDHRRIVILDINLSKAILGSNNFMSYNYFNAGLKKLSSSGCPLVTLERFYNESLLFLENKEHLELKRDLIKILDEMTVELDKSYDLISSHIEKKINEISTILDFSQQVVIICAAIIISKLRNIQINDAIRALELHENIFFSFFHPIRQRKADTALKLLESISNKTATDVTTKHKQRLADSFMMMGYDTLVSSICAYHCDKMNNPNLVPRIYPSVSLISKKCVKNCKIKDITFNAKDLVYLSLIPSIDRLKECPKNSTPVDLTFGFGRHSCIGKKLSIKITLIAEQLWNKFELQDKLNLPELDNNGVLLSFRNHCIKL